MVANKTLGSSAKRFLHLLKQSQPIWMGILNVTPDSFSDGGSYVNADAALSHAKKLVSQGASIIDVGGASTRPGAELISHEVELERVLPILKMLRSEFGSNVFLSLDSYSPLTCLAAAEYGCVDILNDVYAGRRSEKQNEIDLTTIEVAAKFNLAWIAMHMLGAPSTMQTNPTYQNCIEEVKSFLIERVEVARASGVKAIIVDPGIGFGKSVENNMALLSEQGIYTIGQIAPLLIGVSRKRFLTHVHPELSESRPNERDVQSKLWEKLAFERGAAIVRTHCVGDSIKSRLV